MDSSVQRSELVGKFSSCKKWDWIIKRKLHNWKIEYYGPSDNEKISIWAKFFFSQLKILQTCISAWGIFVEKESQV